MENNKLLQLYRICDFILKKLVPYILFIIFTYVTILALFRASFGVASILTILDTYSKLILSSWPATIFILGIIVLWRHHDAIDHFIRERMTGIGVDGIKGDLISSASDTEIKTKTILDKNVDEKIESKTIINHTKIESKPTPEIINSKNQERYKKVLEVENLVHTSLIEKYGEQYKPQVKLSSPGKIDIILDGIILSHGKISAAVEIKYVSSKNYDAIRFIIARMKTKLATRGITRLIMVIVGDGLTKEDAQKIKETNLNLTKRIFFYRREENGDLHELLID